MAKYRIAIDAMGGDNAPQAIVAGALKALRQCSDIQILLAGPGDVLEGLIGSAAEKDRIEIIPAAEVISMEEAPMMAVRKKADSSMVRAMMAVREKRADAALSCGSTGAVLACGMMRLGRIKGIERPALAPVLPGVKGPWLLIDSGANVDCQPKFLEQFGLMGSVYMQSVMGIDDPAVGLVNIGVEAEKGNKLTHEAYQLMQAQSSFRFAGSCEAREIPSGDFQVVVADGFDGNIILKYTEGLVKALMHMLKDSLLSTSTWTKLGAALAKPAFASLKTRFDYNAVGGAPLLGVEGAVVKAHGSSGEEAVCSAVLQARRMVEGDVVNKIKAGLDGLSK